MRRYGREGAETAQARVAVCFTVNTRARTSFYVRKRPRKWPIDSQALLFGQNGPPILQELCEAA